MKYHSQLQHLAFFVFLLSIGTGCKKNKDITPISTAADSIKIEDKVYPTVAIGNQVWTTFNYSGPGGISHNSADDKPEYGRYYTFEEVIKIHIPKGWRLPTRQDYIKMAEHEKIIFTDNRAMNQEAIKNLVSINNWRSIPGTNTSGFNAQPGGYGFQNQPPQDGDIAEFWTSEGYTISIQETAGGKTHKISFYNNSNSPEYRFNLRFVRSE